MKDKIKAWLVDNDHQFSGVLKPDETYIPNLAGLINDCLQDIDGWVSVDDRLPPYNTPVWTELESGQVCMMSFDEIDDYCAWCMIYGMPYYDHGKWQYEAEYDDEYKVAKWKPLPEPPKKGKTK